MIITTHDLNLLYQIEVHCEKCIRACVYADAVGGTDDNMWAFTQNCFAEASILHWCRVFGSRGEPTHFTHFFGGKCFGKQDGSRLTLENVRVRLYRAAHMSEADYLAFWKNVKKGRDKYFVHDEFSVAHRGQFPDLDVFKRTALEMREVIHEVVSQEQSEDPNKHKRFCELVQWHRNSKYLQDLKDDARRFKNLMTSGQETGHTREEASQFDVRAQEKT